jgi:hypothetical protein
MWGIPNSVRLTEAENVSAEFADGAELFDESEQANKTPIDSNKEKPRKSERMLKIQSAK